MATFRHKTIRRFTIPRSRSVPREFKFLNHLLHIDNEREADIFRGIVERLPRSQSVNIVEVNEAAVAALEKPVRKAIRGVQQSTQIADAELAAKQAKAKEEAARVEAEAEAEALKKKEKEEAESKAKADEAKALAEEKEKAKALVEEKAKLTPTLNIQGKANPADTDKK